MYLQGYYYETSSHNVPYWPLDAQPGNEYFRIATESAIRRGKSTLTRKLIVTTLALAYAPLILAAPDGGNVSAGSGTITQVGTATTINQQSQNLAID